MLGGAARLLEHARPGVLCRSRRLRRIRRASPPPPRCLPTAVILGSRDLMTPVKGGKAVAASSGRTRQVPGAGHMLMSRAPRRGARRAARVRPAQRLGRTDRPILGTMTPALLALTAICRHAVARCSRWHLILGHQQSADRDSLAATKIGGTPQRQAANEACCRGLSLHRFRWRASRPRSRRKGSAATSAVAGGRAASAARRLVCLGSLPVSRLQPEGADPHRLRRGDRARALARLLGVEISLPLRPPGRTISTRLPPARRISPRAPP